MESSGRFPITASKGFASRKDHATETNAARPWREACAAGGAQTAPFTMSPEPGSDRRERAQEAVARVRETLKRPPIRLTLEELREAKGESV